MMKFISFALILISTNSTFGKDKIIKYSANINVDKNNYSYELESIDSTPHVIVKSWGSKKLEIELLPKNVKELFFFQIRVFIENSGIKTLRGTSHIESTINHEATFEMEDMNQVFNHLRIKIIPLKG